MLLFLLAALNFTHIIDFVLMMPLGAQLMRILQITPKEHAALVSAYTFAAGVAGFFGAFAIDRFDRRRALLFSYLMFTLGTLFCGISPNYQSLLFARAFTGAFGGMQSALVYSIIGDAIPLNRRGAAMGLVMSSFSLGSIIGVPFGLYLATRFNWGAPFIFVGAVGVVVWIFIFAFMPSMRDHLAKQKVEIDPFGVMRFVLKDPNQLTALFFTFTMMMAQFSIVPFVSPYMVKNVGLSEDQLPYIYFCGGLATIFTAPLVGRLSDRFGKARIFQCFSVFAIIPILLITNLPASPIGFGILATTLFFISSNGRMVPASTMITAVVESAHRGTFTSFNSSVQQLSASLASFIAGLIVVAGADGHLHNYQFVGYFSVFTVLCAMYVSTKIKMKS